MPFILFFKENIINQFQYFYGAGFKIIKETLFYYYAARFLNQVRV